MSRSSLIAKIPVRYATLLKKTVQPACVAPMLATLTKTYFSDKEWVYEHKFDGERCLAFKKNGKVRLLSRNKHSMNAIYPELVAALEQQKADNFIIDGEIISQNKKGVSDFQLLQGRMNRRLQSDEKQAQVAISYCIFDLMYVDGYDVRNLPLLERKKLLKNLLVYNHILSYSEHTLEKGIELFKTACKLKWEGVIAKRADSAYVGARSRNWLKFKCIMQQELVIGGYTQPQGSRSYFGALLVGYYARGKLMYAGKVGTGYSAAVLKMLGTKLKKLATNTCPFADYDGPAVGVQWVKPEVVAEFQFAQWTAAGRLRVGRYKGLRDDKNAQDVVKEVPKAIGP